jgi:predicted CopG family antitoxin
MLKKKYTKMASVLLTDKTYRQLITVTKEKEMSISAFVRKLLEKQLAINPMEETI